MPVPSTAELIAKAQMDLATAVDDLADALQRVNTPALSDDKGMFLVALIRRARRSVEEAQECALRREREQPAANRTSRPIR